MTIEELTGGVVAAQGMLYRVSASVLRQPCDQEDAVQSAIEKAWGKLGTLRDADKLEGWIVRILLNECYTIKKKRKRETHVEAFAETPAPMNADPDLYRFFTGLPEKLRVPMTLFYVEGYALREVEQILRLPVGTVKTRLSRGREKMKQDHAFEEVQWL